MVGSALKLWLVFVLSSVAMIISSEGKYPESCNAIECPNYQLLEEGNGFEIRLYNSTLWISTPTIQDISLVDATRTGFLGLFKYIQGKNAYKAKIEMTAPVLTKVSPSDGPFCESSFTVSFYVPQKNQADPPPAQGLTIQRWKPTYAAVRQFSGFVSDSNVGEQAAALQASLKGTVWDMNQSPGPHGYIVAQYNSPFQFEGRVNEIWMLFYKEDKSAF